MSKLNLSIVIFLLIFMVLLGVILQNPVQLKPLFNENKLVENATAAAYLTTFFLLFYKIYPKNQTPNKYLLPLFIFSIFAFLEEINYGIPFFVTPPLIAHKELDNLHNLIEIFLRLDWYQTYLFYSIIGSLILLPLFYIFQEKRNKSFLVVVSMLVNSLLGLYTLLIFFIVPYKRIWVNHIQPALFSELFILTMFGSSAVFLLYLLNKASHRNNFLKYLDRLDQNPPLRKLFLRMLSFGFLLGMVGVLIYPIISSLWVYYLYYLWMIPILYYCATLCFVGLLLLIGWKRPISKQIVGLLTQARSLVSNHMAYKIFIASLVILASAQILDLELIDIGANVVVEEFLEFTASTGMLFSALSAQKNLEARAD